ncbi:putative HTH-type transcriptional regulator YfiR [Thermoflexales bacterium]|nr:putative HTH-type transcriptional regulator YfiR [Thermoflexales bacterium]
MPRPDVSVERKLQIVEAAIQVFARKGFDAARMEDIAHEAGLSIGGVYWYFKSKDEVIVGIMQAIIDADVKTLRDLLDAPGTVHERLTQYVQATITAAIETTSLCYELYGLALRDTKVRRHIRAFFTTYRDVLAEFVQQGVKRGEYRKVDVNLIATMFAALYEGMLEMTMLDPVGVDAEVMLLGALDLIFAGLEAK